jgi:hypothetical protein
LDWEYPAKRGGTPADRENFVDLVRVSEQMNNINDAMKGTTVEYQVLKLCNKTQCNHYRFSIPVRFVITYG